jgi:hypothetical protein
MRWSGRPGLLPGQRHCREAERGRQYGREAETSSGRCWWAMRKSHMSFELQVFGITLMHWMTQCLTALFIFAAVLARSVITGSRLG